MNEELLMAMMSKALPHTEVKLTQEVDPEGHGVCAMVGEKGVSVYRVKGGWVVESFDLETGESQIQGEYQHAVTAIQSMITLI